MGVTPTPPLRTTRDVMARLGCSRHDVRQHMRRGRLPLAQQLPGPKGAFLFAAEDVERLAAALAAEAKARAEELEAAAG